MNRRWLAGMAFEVDGVFYRVLRGRKEAPRGAEDLRLEHRVDGVWRPVRMQTGAMLADFFFENEDVLYPRPRFNGGTEYLSYLWDAAYTGWEHSEGRLQEQKTRRRESPWEGGAA
jgi:hypothetical protein